MPPDTLRFEPSISIHAPRVGSDHIFGYDFDKATGFQSTLPAWGATPMIVSRCSRTRHFNPRSPRGERPCAAGDNSIDVISIHAPRVGSDRGVFRRKMIKDTFQSTLPAWGATRT